MTASVRIWESVARHAPFGLRLWDIAAATHLVDGLEIDVAVRSRSTNRTRARINRSGIYYAFGVPGLYEFELGASDDAAAWSAALRPYRVEVRDPAGRFLPFAFDADLPARGLFNWLAPWTSPPEPWVSPIEHGSPPSAMVERVPLFSSPTRPVPEPLAGVRAQLRELGTDRPAAWCLLTVSIDGAVRGIGLADQEGRVAVLFPYPDRPRPTVASPPLATNDFRWNVELSAYYVPPPPHAAAPDIPDLAEVLAQLNSPRTLFHSTASPPQALPVLSLEYRVPLTVRTEITATGPSSFLFLDTA